MDELIISPSSSSSFISSQSSQEAPPSLQQRLQLILQSQPDHWSYAIFWQSSSSSPPNDRNTPGPGPILSWADGHFQPTTTNNNNKNPLVPKDDENSAEWFYIMSLTRSFSGAGGGAPANAFSSGFLVWLTGASQLKFHDCERVKAAQIHGIRTLVFIPTLVGVLELGSGDVVKENWGLVQQAKSLFGSDLDLVLPSNGNGSSEFLDGNDVCFAEEDMVDNGGTKQEAMVETECCDLGPFPVPTAFGEGEGEDKG